MKRIVLFILEFLYIALVGFPIALIVWILVCLGYELFKFFNFLIKLKNGISRKTKKR